ncbi:hypothetical protein ACFQ2M_37005 [Kitasatospora saccharophila]|uniref:hypothetical protein n=1 Tax=Kitasatospora saccharophila TaxID=407973 RepID=UPI0036334B0E
MGARIGLTPRQLRLFRRFHGLDQVRLDPDGTLLDLLDAAVRALPELRGNEHRVRYLLHARSTPVAAPYPLNPLHQLRERFGLTNAEAFTVTQQACAASLLAVDLAGRLLADDGDPSALALVVAGRRPSPGTPNCCPAPRSSPRRRRPAWSARTATATACSPTRCASDRSSTAGRSTTRN